MNFFDFLLSKQDNKHRESEKGPIQDTNQTKSQEQENHQDPFIRDLIKSIEQKIQHSSEETAKQLDERTAKIRQQIQDSLQKNKEIYKQKDMNLANNATGKPIEEENIELEIRPSLANNNYSTALFQQLTEQVQKLEQNTVSKETHVQLKQETSRLKQALLAMNAKIKRLEHTVNEYNEQKSYLQGRLEQIESQYEHQFEQNQYMGVQLKQLQEQMIQVQQSKTEDVTQQLTDEIDLPFSSFIPEEEVVKTDLEKDQGIENLEQPSVLEIELKEEMEPPALDKVILEDTPDEQDLLVEKEVDEAQMVQSMSEVLLQTMPNSNEGPNSSFPVYDKNSFLSRDDDSEHNYLRRVLKKLNMSMRDIQKIEFDSTYEIDYATAYVKGIMRKRNYEHNRRLQHMKDRPYIGRVDYVTAAGAETMYIGEQGVDGYVISWKAEAASLYYLRTVGQPIEHRTLGETIVDYIRQIDIQSGRIKTLHPPITATSQFFKDEGLVSALANKRGLDMQSIVATLQREQYEIIRLPMTKPIIIQGSAGSGKSAIALHRLSYLLYKYENLKPENVAILGPNEAFLKHILNVLPTLGDFGIKQTTFFEMACAILMVSPSKVKRHQQADLEMIKTKGSLEFRKIVQQTTKK